MYSLLSTFVTSPTCYIAIPLIIAICVKGKNWKRIFYGITIGLVLIFTSPALVGYLSKQWYQEYDHPLPEGKTYAYGIVLGGYSDWDWQRNRIEFSEIVDRLLEGIRLYKLGIVQKLVLASDGSIIETKTDEGIRGNPDGMRAFLSALCVPLEDVILETKANNTRENAVFTLNLIGDDLKTKPTLLITSAIHARRTLLAFEQEGMSPDIYITDTDIKVRGQSIRLLPSIYAMAQWGALLHEYMGYWAYRWNR